MLRRPFGCQKSRLKPKVSLKRTRILIKICNCGAALESNDRMHNCFSVILVNQEESQRNYTLITKVKIFEDIMIDKDPNVIDYHWEFYTQQSFVPFKLCLKWKNHESFLSLGIEEEIVICRP